MSTRVHGGGDVDVVPLLQPLAWAVDGHQQVQGDMRRARGESLLNVSHNRRHPRKFAGLSLKETGGSVFVTQPRAGWESTAICCRRCRSTNPHHRGAEQIPVTKRSNSDQMSPLEKSLGGGEGCVAGGSSKQMWCGTRGGGEAGAPAPCPEPPVGLLAAGAGGD